MRVSLQGLAQHRFMARLLLLHSGCWTLCDAPCKHHLIIRGPPRLALLQATLLSVVLAPRIASEAVQAGLEALASDDPTAVARALELTRRGQEPPVTAGSDGSSGAVWDGSAMPQAPPTPPDPVQPVTAAQTRAAAAVALGAAAARAKLMAEEQEVEMERAARRVLRAQLLRVKTKMRYLEQIDEVGTGSCGMWGRGC